MSTPTGDDDEQNIEMTLEEFKCIQEEISGLKEQNLTRNQKVSFISLLL
jgi:hypothetical protein